MADSLVLASCGCRFALPSGDLATACQTANILAHTPPLVKNSLDGPFIVLSAPELLSLAHAVFLTHLDLARDALALPRHHFN